MFLDADSEDRLNWAEMPRLISVFAVRMGHLIVLSCGGPNCFENRKYECIKKGSFYSVW